MANVTEKQATAENLYCFLSKTLIEDTRHQLIFVSAFNIFLSVAALLGNAVILDALHKEFSIHPPSKLFFRCLATTDICVGVLTEPLSVYYWMSVVNERWNNCRYVVFASFFTSNVLSAASLLTATAISVDRLLALLLRLRYRQVVTVKRTFAVLAAFWIISIAVATMPLWNFLVYIWCAYTVITVCLVTAIFTYTKIFRTLRHHQNRIYMVCLYSHNSVFSNRDIHLYKDIPHPPSPSKSSSRSSNNSAEFSATEKGSVQCSLGAVDHGCLLSTVCDSWYSGTSFGGSKSTSIFIVLSY